MIPPDDVEDENDRNEFDSADRRTTRSQQTRAATEVNQLGLRLTRLSSTELNRLELPERLREEIDVSQRLKPRARGRQNRLIGQLLRAEDHEAIRMRVDLMKGARLHEVQHEKQSEAWLDRLIEEGDGAIEDLIGKYPHAERQRLRSLSRNARQKVDVKKMKRARRELFRTIRALLVASS